MAPCGSSSPSPSQQPQRAWSLSIVSADPVRGLRRNTSRVTAKGLGGPEHPLWERLGPSRTGSSITEDAGAAGGPAGDADAAPAGTNFWKRAQPGVQVPRLCCALSRKHLASLAPQVSAKRKGRQAPQGTESAHLLPSGRIRPLLPEVSPWSTLLQTPRPCVEDTALVPGVLRRRLRGWGWKLHVTKHCPDLPQTEIPGSSRTHR